MSENKGTPKELTIVSVEGPNEHGWYVARTSEGHKYGSKSSEMMKYAGKTATFNTVSEKSGKYWNNYINKPFPEISEAKSESQVQSSYDKGKESNTALMCAKDIVLRKMELAILPDMSPSALVNEILQIRSGLLSGIEAAMKSPDEDEIPF